MDRRVELAKTAGFCYGVKRAVDIAIKSGRENASGVWTYGPLIHNQSVVDMLSALSVGRADRIDDIPPGSAAIIRAHGISRDELLELTDKCRQVIDATCPFVKKIHNIAAQKSAEGKRLIIIGKAEHPEVLGIAGWSGDCVVFEGPEEIKERAQKYPEELEKPACVVAQTTIARKNFDNCVDVIRKLYTKAEIFDTICNATNERQQEAAELAGRADAVIVIGDRASSNTARLAEICRERCENVISVESAAELDLSSFSGCRYIGITAGASTPEWKIKEVYQLMSDEVSKVKEENESFAEMLEQSIKTLHTGEKVTGTVTNITPTEIQVDLGTKHAGYIPMDELSDDPSVKPEVIARIGSEIEVFVMKVSDAEGTVLLSKKRLDTVKGWEKVNEACESKDILEGVVVEDNKGGVVVSVNGVRVFVPASQTGVPKETPLSTMVKSRVKLRITEVNRAKHRVVGSIRSASMDERRQRADKVWETIEVGAKYTGEVRSITSFGVFVDIGGVDGMVHITELSWNRIKHPSEVVNIGDKIDVYVISFDKEKKKISLGHRDQGANPWQKFLDTCHSGDIVKAKVVKLMPFGAFAEVLPGVDGLIHISQISERRISRPGEVLNEGQEIEAKIIKIDEENKKISLSIRALTDDTVEMDSEEQE